MIHRIHILGATGSGTTTLGRALAERLPCPHFETDGYCWVPTDPPYTTQRERTERQQLLLDDVTVHDSWVVSGSLCGWGDVAMPFFALVVFLSIPQDIRMERLYRRVHTRFGTRILPGGDMYAHRSPKFGGKSQIALSSEDEGDTDYYHGARRRHSAATGADATDGSADVVR